MKKMEQFWPPSHPKEEMLSIEPDLDGAEAITSSSRLRIAGLSLQSEIAHSKLELAEIYR